MLKDGAVAVDYSVTITEAMLGIFAGLFEQISPLHTDDGYARAQGFKGRIVPQLLIVTQFLPMVEYHLPGKYGLGLGANNLVFINPVYVGDTLSFKGKVIKISRAAKLLVIEISVINQESLPVATCHWKVRVLK